MKHKSFLIWVFLVLVLYKIHDLIAKSSPELITNKGVSFGIGYGLVSISVLFCVLILYIGIKQNRLYLWLILAGGWSNLIDRFREGMVRDYWQIGQTGIYNNINDWIIALGVIIFLTEPLWKKQLK